MELKIEMEELRKRSVMLCTPCYGGQCHGIFARSVSDLSTLCTQAGIDLKVHFLFNESLVQRSRNYLADEFLRSHYTHMMFVDSDIGFNANDVIALLALQSDESEYDIIGGAYPKKNISWEKIKMAVDKGIADENPDVLERYVGDYVFNPKVGNSITLSEPAEVSELGTGFMMIRRKTFEKYREAYPELLYKPDHARTEHFNGSREIMAFFDCVIDPDSKRYLSEDYFFCYQAQKAGMKTWLCPWIGLVHAGSYMFGGSLADIAMLGASATVGEEYLKKKKEKK